MNIQAARNDRVRQYLTYSSCPSKFNNFVPAFIKTNKKDAIVLRSFSELIGHNMAAANIIPTVDFYMVITNFNKKKVTGYRFNGQFDQDGEPARKFFSLPRSQADIVRPGYGDKVSLVRIPSYLADKANLNHTVV